MAASAPLAGAVPAKFWGVVPQATQTLDRLQRLRGGGVDSIRIPLGWEAVQPVANGPYDWSEFDARFEAATGAGLEVLPFLTGAPPWAVPAACVPGTRCAARAPRNLPARGAAAKGWSRFVRATVARYGSSGAFWAEHPELPRRPVRFWQVWNEQNFKYFVARPNPAEYGKLVKATYAAVHRVDRRAKLVLGGMFARPREALFKRRPPQAYFATDFLDRMYRSTPGVKRKFVGVALHPYTGRYQRLLPYIEEFRRVLSRHRDARKGLWITELGWSSQRPARNNSFAKGRRGQVRQLKGAFRLFKRRHAKWHLKRVYWFSVDDQVGVCNFCDGTGLFAAGFVPKPSWYAYARFAGGRPR
jgi:hypothetical protein